MNVPARDEDKTSRGVIVVWIIIALLAIAALPFTARGYEVARAIASFCGFTL